MAEAITNELIYEILTKIQADFAHIKTRIDHRDQLFVGMAEAV